jgi:hypothetical protein
MHEQDLEWEALEYRHTDKTSDWYWGLGLLALAGIGLSIFFSNILFAAVILLGASTLALFGARPPHMMRFSITDRGISIGNNLYPYGTLESFWVIDDPHTHPQLLIKSKKLLMPLIIIPIAQVNPNDIREKLLDKLSEEEHHEPLSEKLLQFFHY